ncbi:zinc finger BED domain-containing protein RICESLEEPER 1-like [Quercus lobata]|uniref:zinc finger BED domain-containing protein RICESLEEPER 1-like n=1 Tax=Quercus lobata TaxID=97700 RepID=UPI0012485B2B|nr:zinc finger BED domain-containing protein RICESLEEPER 1-like [Quercus lobata]
MKDTDKWTPSLRGFLLGQIRSIVSQLQSKGKKDFLALPLNDFFSTLSEVEGLRVKVNWLKSRVIASRDLKRAGPSIHASLSSLHELRAKESSYVNKVKETKSTLEICEVESQQMDAPTTENLDAVINIDENEESIKNNDVKLEENPFKQKKRKRTSMIWNDFNEIILPDETKKVQCIHCLKRLAYSNNGETTQYHRHLKGCLSRKLANKKQKQLAVNEGGVESEVAIANFKYDHAKVKEKASHMILVHEYPFNTMEHEVFNVFMKIATPYYQKISRNTARNDCISTFELEKKKLKTMLGSSFLDWGLENKVCTITLNNANNNDATVRILKDAIKRKLMLGGKIFHVQDGLSEIEMMIENIRESVKYLLALEACLIKFGEIAKQLQLPSKKLILGCPTHWNATYAMLATTLEFREVFPRYKDRVAGYNWLPSNEDWDRTEHVCNFLSVFEEVTNVISGSEYPTANIFLLEVWKIKEALNEKSLDENDYISAMACKMKLKFDKYWGECNFVMAIAVVLDPRFKMTLINFSFPKIYQGFEVARNINCVHDSLYELYNEYVAHYTSSNAGQSASKSTKGSSSVGDNNSKFKTRGRMEFDQFVRNADNIQPLTTPHQLRCGIP